MVNKLRKDPRLIWAEVERHAVRFMELAQEVAHVFAKDLFHGTRFRRHHLHIQIAGPE